MKSLNKVFLSAMIFAAMTVAGSQAFAETKESDNKATRPSFGLNVDELLKENIINQETADKITAYQEKKRAEFKEAFEKKLSEDRSKGNPEQWEHRSMDRSNRNSARFHRGGFHNNPKMKMHGMKRKSPCRTGHYGKKNFNKEIEVPETPKD